MLTAWGSFTVLGALQSLACFASFFGTLVVRVGGQHLVGLFERRQTVFRCDQRLGFVQQLCGGWGRRRRRGRQRRCRRYRGRRSRRRRLEIDGRFPLLQELVRGKPRRRDQQCSGTSENPTARLFVPATYFHRARNARPRRWFPGTRASFAGGGPAVCSRRGTTGSARPGEARASRWPAPRVSGETGQRSRRHRAPAQRKARAIRTPRCHSRSGRPSGRSGPPRIGSRRGSAETPLLGSSRTMSFCGLRPMRTVWPVSSTSVCNTSRGRSTAWPRVCSFCHSGSDFARCDSSGCRLPGTAVPSRCLHLLNRSVTRPQSQSGVSATRCRRGRRTGWRFL